SEERSRLEQVGVYFGERYVYLGALFTGRALVQRQAWVSTVAALPEIPTGAVRVEPARQISARVYQQLGFSRVGSHYLRIDLLERALACLAAQPSRFQPPGEVSQWLG